MKKRIIISLIIILSIALFGCERKSLEKDNIKNTNDNYKKEIIIANLKLLQEKFQEESEISDSKNYKTNMNYKTIVNIGNDAVPILIDMYKNKELDESSSYIAAEAIQEITDCNIEKKYNLDWDSPEEFFKIWGNIPNIEEKKLKSLSTDVVILFNKYPDMADIISKSNIKLPELENMIPQGITIVKDYFIITTYDKSGESNSKCFVLSKNGELKNIVTLDTNSHVGAISYDPINNLLWTPEHNGILNAYNADDFFTQEEVSYKYSFDDVGDRLKNYENKLKSLIAYLCIKDNKIFIGSFDDTDKGIVKEYEIINNEDGSISLNYLKEFKVPPKVQGIEFYEYNNDTYMILSCSYGRFSQSNLNIYKYDEEILDYGSSLIKKITIKLPPMLEQVTSVSNNLYVLFESKAKEYDNCLEKISDICVFDLNKIISKWNEKIEKVIE